MKMFKTMDHENILRKTMQEKLYKCRGGQQHSKCIDESDIDAQF